MSGSRVKKKTMPWTTRCTRTEADERLSDLQQRVRSQDAAEVALIRSGDAGARWAIISAGLGDTANEKLKTINEENGDDYKGQVPR